MSTDDIDGTLVFLILSIMIMVFGGLFFAIFMGAL